MMGSIGQKVLIIDKKHPCTGKTGVIARFEMAKVIRKPACVIKLDEGREVMVFSREAVKFL